jgi:hypothetical protein
MSSVKASTPAPAVPVTAAVSTILLDLGGGICLELLEELVP